MRLCGGDRNEAHVERMLPSTLLIKNLQTTRVCSALLMLCSSLGYHVLLNDAILPYVISLLQPYAHETMGINAVVITNERLQ